MPILSGHEVLIVWYTLKSLSTLLSNTIHALVYSIYSLLLGLITFSYLVLFSYLHSYWRIFPIHPLFLLACLFTHDFLPLYYYYFLLIKLILKGLA